MGTQTRPATGRSPRDELEQLQEELREVRDQRGALPRENAELTAQVDRLKEEIRALEQARDSAHTEWAKPIALPEQLVTPFCAVPSRQTVYGRTRFALSRVVRSLPVQGLVVLFSNFFFRNSPVLGSVLLGANLAWFTLRFVFSQAFEDEDERQAWSFDDEGFKQPAASGPGGKVLYSEVRIVDIHRGWLERLLGAGSVRVTWTSEKPVSIGRRVGEKTYSVDISLYEAPERLAQWLKERTQAPQAEKPGEPHAD